MAKQRKSKLVGVRFRDRKGHFTKAQTGTFSKAESYDKKTFKTLKKEKRFSKREASIRRINLIRRTPTPVRLVAAPIPPAPEERKNYKVTIEYIVSPPKVEFRVMHIRNATIEERDSQIADRINFLVEELGAGIANVRIEEIL